jgi:hypothetical protein
MEDENVLLGDFYSFKLTKFSLAFLLILGCLGFFLMGFGITGFVALDETTKSLCQTNSQCSIDEVCCLFYQKSAGVCHAPNFCPRITEITKAEVEKNNQVSNNDLAKKSIADFPYREKYFSSIIIGFFITLTVGLIIYIISKKYPNKK